MYFFTSRQHGCVRCVDGLSNSYVVAAAGLSAIVLPWRSLNAARACSSRREAAPDFSAQSPRFRPSSS